jgi:peptidoglycan hydrolase CwlO-like protein
MERMQQRQANMRKAVENLEAQAAQLERIVTEQEQLLTDARAYLAQLQGKRSALAEEYRRITGRELTARP